MRCVDMLYNPKLPSKLGIRGPLLGAEMRVSGVSFSVLTMIGAFVQLETILKRPGSAQGIGRKMQLSIVKWKS